MAHLVFADTHSNAEKTKRAIFFLRLTNRIKNNFLYLPNISKLIFDKSKL